MDDAGCKVQGAWCTEYIPPLKRVRGMFFVVPGVRWSKILPHATCTVQPAPFITSLKISK